MTSRTKVVDLYRRDAKSNHTLLSKKERRTLVESYLPSPPTASPVRSATIIRPPGIRGDELKMRSRLGVRRFFKHQVHLLVYIIIHAVFSVYVRMRQAYHALKDRIIAILFYHHRTPGLIQRDVKVLKRLPKHLSVVLRLENGGKGGAALEALVDEAAEIAAWCACAGIPILSIYERTGILKGYLPGTHRALSRKLSAYLGPHHPTLSVRAPHISAMESGISTPTSEAEQTKTKQLSVLLLSAEDGRDSLVDLTKTLTEMSQRSKLSISDISQDLIDAEITESVMGEPDLLVLFGPSIELCGYPPWQLRLTEIYHVQDNHGVGYQVFLRALYNYGDAQMRVGR